MLLRLPSSVIDFDVEATWQQVFDQEIEEQIEKTGTQPNVWKAAGKATKANPDKENGKWWEENGLAFSRSYIEWRESIQWNIWTTPEGVPAIELDLRCKFGEVPVRTIIDRIFVTPDGELVVVDLKTGAQMPKDQGLQLGFYASAVEQVFGVRPAWCAYWNARKGGLSEPYYPNHLTPEFLGQMLEEFMRVRENGPFIPNLSMNCGNCGVARACAAKNGPEAHLYDPLYLEIKSHG